MCFICFFHVVEGQYYVFVCICFMLDSGGVVMFLCVFYYVGQWQCCGVVCVSHCALLQ